MGPVAAAAAVKAAYEAKKYQDDPEMPPPNPPSGHYWLWQHPAYKKNPDVPRPMITLDNNMTATLFPCANAPYREGAVYHDATTGKPVYTDRGALMNGWDRFTIFGGSPGAPMNICVHDPATYTVAWYAVSDDDVKLIDRPRQFDHFGPMRPLLADPHACEIREHLLWFRRDLQLGRWAIDLAWSA